MLKTADFKTCAQIQPKRGWCFVRKLFLCIFFFLFPIFSFATALPSGYTQLEYIQSDGTQFIDTGIVPADNFDVTVTVSFDDLLGIVLGSRTTTRTSDRLIILGHTDSGLGYDYGELDQSITRPAYDDLEINTKYKIQLSGTLNHVDYYVNNQLTASQNTNRQSSTYNLWLFNANTGSTATIYGLKGKMYSCKIINNGETVRNFVPARRNSDNSVGMYDTVTNTFFGVSYTGYYTLDYIGSTGTQYIDTGIKPNSNTEIEAKFSLNSVDNYQCLVGARIRNEAQNQNKDSFTIWANTVGNQIRFDYDERVTNSNINVSVNTPYVVTKIKERNYVNGIETDSNTVSTFTCDYNLFLFGVNTFGDSPKPYYMDGKIYYVKIWDNGTLVRDFIPVQRISDGVIGMLDKISDQFFTNAGTGTFTTGTNVGTYTPNFIAGPVVLPSEYTELEYIHFDGVGTYIDTGLKWYTNIPTNKAKFVVDAKVYNTNNAYNTIIGNHSGNGLNLAVYTSNHNFWYGNGASANATSSGIVNPETRCLFSYDIVNGSLDIYDKENDITVGNITGINATVKTVAMPILLGAQCDMNSPSYVRSERTTMDLYNVQIYNDSVLVRDLIPAKRNSDNAIGLYDAVNNVFYTNSGTGSFVAGLAVSDEPSCEYTRLEYIESTGTQYIDTGINADSDLGVDFKYQFTSTSPRQRIGAIYDNGAPVTTNASNYIRHHLNVDSRSHSDVEIGYYIGLFDDNFDLSNPIDTNIHTFVLDTVNDRYIVDGNTNTYNADNFDTHLNYWLFIRNSNNSDLYSPSSMRIYYFKMKRNGALVRDFMPAKRKSDGAVGMYDTVTNTFFENAGTGTFIAGPELAWGNNCSVTISITWGGLAEPDASGMCTYGETFTAPSTAPTAPSGLKFLGWIPR